MTAYLLDTNALLLLSLESRTTSLETRQALAQGRRFVSQVCAIEIAIKYNIGKLTLPSPFDLDFSHAFLELTRSLEAEVLNIELSHVATMSRLPLRHRDPFDRLIIAQALTEDMTVITRDRIFKNYESLSVMEI